VGEPAERDDGVALQAVRERGARQERVHARQAALPLQGLRCGLNFTDTPPRGLPLRLKVEAVLLYLSGLSMNRTAKLLGVSTPTVQAWIERFAEVYAQKPEPEGRAVVVELDEMWHYLKKSRTSSGSGRLGIVLRDGSSTGSWVVVTEPLSSVSLSA
jgi:transposase